MNMTTFPILGVSPIVNLIVLFWVFVSIALILLVLIQKGRGGGLSSAFGGGGANSLLGTKTTDWLTKATIGIVLLFLLLTVVLNLIYKPKLSEDIQKPVNVNTSLPDQSGQPETPALPPEIPTE
jgi:preprotein translocase subunit SecG